MNSEGDTAFNRNKRNATSPVIPKRTKDKKKMQNKQDNMLAILQELNREIKEVRK